MMVFVDFNIKQLFGDPTNLLTSPLLHTFKQEDPNQVTKFLEDTHEQLEEIYIHRQTEKLMKYTWKINTAKKLENYTGK